MNLVNLKDTKLTYKNLLHLYTLSVKCQRDIKETIPFTTASKKKKRFLGINLPKRTKDLYSKSYNMLMKEIKEDISRWKDTPCSWMGRICIVKMTILPKASKDSMQSQPNYQRYISQN